MTSVPFNVGLSDNTRSSSRVLRPPGGGHTDIFGGEPEPQNKGVRRFNGNAAAQQDNMKQVTEQQSNGDKPKNAEPMAAVPEAPVEAQVETKADSPRVVAAEEPKASSQPAESTKAEAPKRVRVPPGGFSSGLW